MKIDELIIDGFKSYAVRTTIDKWDPTFNAITVCPFDFVDRFVDREQGLNGSGKSNILDAICFVLGITNMSTVRAQNLQDLIYKRGQAGVTKASVTIVFDNKDTRKSPIGFEEYAQISVTRQVHPSLQTIRLLTPDRDGRTEQVPHQRSSSTTTDGPKLVSVRSTQHQQPQLSHHARSHHKSPQHETSRDSGHVGGSGRDTNV